MNAFNWAPDPDSSTSKQVNLTELRRLLSLYFDEGELRTLCFDLRVDYDDLPGAGKTNKARDLVAFLERRDRIPELLQVGRRFRPDISWEEVFQVGPDLGTGVIERPRWWNWQYTGLLALVVVSILVVAGISIIVRGRGGGGVATKSVQPTTNSAQSAGTPAPKTSSLTLSLASTHLAGENVRDILLVDGEVWAAVDFKGVSRLDGEWRHYTADDWLLAPMALAQSSDGRVWVGDYENGLAVLDPGGQISATFTYTTSSLAENTVTALVLAKEGGIWVGTWGAVQHLNSQGNWKTIFSAADSEGNHVNDVAVDERQGDVWIALVNGLEHFDPATQFLESFTHAGTCVTTQTDCLLSDWVNTVFIDAQGRKWIGTGQGLSVLDDDRWRSFTVRNGLPAPDVTAIVADNAGRVYVGTTKGLAVLDVASGQLSQPEFKGGVPPVRVQALALDEDRTALWVGTLEEGISVWLIE